MSDFVGGVAGSDLASRRRSYGASELTERALAGTWLEQLRAWYDEAAAHPEVIEPNAMQVATVDAEGRPDLRTVLARAFDERGVVFYTNYASEKGAQLASRPYAAGLFAWLPLERQVRFRGPVSKTSPAETEAYFQSRPRGAQLAAWASPQSTVLAGRSDLDELLAQVTERFADQDVVPAPPFWGGYRIETAEMEFWQGRRCRLHDRLRFRQAGPATWVVERLAP